MLFMSFSYLVCSKLQEQFSAKIVSKHQFTNIKTVLYHVVYTFYAQFNFRKTVTSKRKRVVKKAFHKCFNPTVKKWDYHKLKVMWWSSRSGHTNLCMHVFRVNLGLTFSPLYSPLFVTIVLYFASLENYCFHYKLLTRWVSKKNFTNTVLYKFQILQFKCNIQTNIRLYHSRILIRRNRYILACFLASYSLLQ